MQQMADHNNAMTMASMQINMEQQETSALASVGHHGAKNIANAAKGHWQWLHQHQENCHPEDFRKSLNYVNFQKNS